VPGKRCGHGRRLAQRTTDAAHNRAARHGGASPRLVAESPAPVQGPRGRRRVDTPSPRRSCRPVRRRGQATSDRPPGRRRARAARPRAWTSARSCAVPIPHASRHPRRPRRQLRRRDGERAPARRSTWALRRAPGRDEGSMAGRRRAQVPSRSSRWSSRPSAHRLPPALRRSRSRAARRRFPRLAVSNAGPP
jgi:hypothetical protein